MLLLIPAIDILNGRSAFQIEGLEEDIGTDPIGIAKLLRTENSKMLHVNDLDGVATGAFTQFDLIRDLENNVDIPIEVSGGISTESGARRLLEMGACRVVLRPGLLVDDRAVAGKILEANGPGKVVVAIERRQTSPAASPSQHEKNYDPLAIGRTARQMGFRRLLYTELDAEGKRNILNTAILSRIASETGLRLTISGGITSFHDLRTIENLGHPEIDSVVLRRSLYENRFSCQKIWRMAEREGYPFTAKL